MYIFYMYYLYLIATMYYVYHTAAIMYYVYLIVIIYYVYLISIMYNLHIIYRSLLILNLLCSSLQERMQPTRARQL